MSISASPSATSVAWWFGRLAQHLAVDRASRPRGRRARGARARAPAYTARLPGLLFRPARSARSASAGRSMRSYTRRARSASAGSSGSLRTSHCADAQRVVEAIGLGVEAVEQQRGVGVERLAVVLAQHALRRRRVLADAVERAEEQAQARRRPARAASARSAYGSASSTRPSARQQLRRGAVQEGRVGILGERALVGGERLVDLAVELELARDQEVVLGRRVRAGHRGRGAPAPPATRMRELRARERETSGQSQRRESEPAERRTHEPR